MTHPALRFAALGVAVTLAAAGGEGRAEEGRPSEDALFGGDAPGVGAFDAGDAPDDGLLPGMSPEPTRFDLAPDPLTVGGQLYLRLQTVVFQDVDAGELPLSMPNLLDLYLDARPHPRVRGFFNGRLRYDPTVSPQATDLFGQPVDAASVAIDQLWLKTDVARAVFLTIGQARVKWGAGRIWNPTDFINRTQRDPLALFDERTGVPQLKVHVPIESLGWNAYGFLLLDSVDTLEQVGGALRLEMAFERAEITLSSVFGQGRDLSFGADLSAGLGEIDLTVEVGVTDARAHTVYEGTLDIAQGVTPSGRPRGTWVARVSAGLDLTIKPNDDDLMIFGAEYFFNPLGYDDAGLYPWLAVQGELEPFYLGRHYGALVWLWPAPGDWDDVSFGLSAIGNLSDLTFVTRLDFSATLHQRLRLEVYLQAHLGDRGGELRFSAQVPDLPAIPGVLDAPIAGFTIPPPLLTGGLNLRLSF